jgi:hypothetical protein
MIKAINRLVMLFLAGVVTSSVAFAETIKKEITFSQPVVVNGTVVKKGTYVAVFDDQANELTITKGRKVIAKAAARLEKHDGPAKVFFETREEAGQTVLVTVAMKGNNQATIVDGESKATSAQ